jgi:uncharacterized protein (TIGR00375 family)
MSPEALWKWAQIKGISMIATGDFTHPLWFRELSEKLEPTGNGLFALKKELQTQDIPKTCKSEVCFLLSAELSCIYSKYGRTRKIRCIVYVPDFASAARLNLSLGKIGNLSADGRPILGLDAMRLLNMVLDISPDALLVPAHAWTPHFSVFGSASGFDSLEECFEGLTPHIHAIETGLSSDPPMNWRISALDKITLISNSDAHSPAKIGREANIFDTQLSYAAMMQAIRTGEGFLGTIEFFPEEGKYHYDGHRACGVSLDPRETLRHNYLCPACGKKVTVGVMHRVMSLADRDEGYIPPQAPVFHSVIPLPEIIAEILKVGVQSKAVNAEYFRLIQSLGNELSILLDRPFHDIEKAGSSIIKEAIARMRAGRVSIAPGFDGEYGTIKIFEEVARKKILGQTMLF